MSIDFIKDITMFFVIDISTSKRANKIPFHTLQYLTWIDTFESISLSILGSTTYNDVDTYFVSINFSQMNSLKSF